MSYEYVTMNLSGAVRREMLEGRPHLVVPTVMIVEGVLNGSQGPLLYPRDELSQAPYVWNHKPIVVGHPQQGSACDPAVLNTLKVGVVLNTRWDAPKLRGEAWLDIDRCGSIDGRIISDLQAGRKIEVSTGLFVDNCSPAGTFNGRTYSAVARNYRPDHLAILLDQVGACSIADGAGMLQLNQYKPPILQPQFQTPEPTHADVVRWLLAAVKRSQGPQILMAQNGEDDEEPLPLPTMNFGEPDVPLYLQPTGLQPSPFAATYNLGAFDDSEEPLLLPTMNFGPKRTAQQPPPQSSPSPNDDDEEPLPLPRMW